MCGDGRPQDLGIHGVERFSVPGSMSVDCGVRQGLPSVSPSHNPDVVSSLLAGPSNNPSNGCGHPGPCPAKGAVTCLHGWQDSAIAGAKGAGAATPKLSAHLWRAPLAQVREGRRRLCLNGKSRLQILTCCLPGTPHIRAFWIHRNATIISLAFHLRGGVMWPKEP